MTEMGINFVVEVNKGDDITPIWVQVAGQKAGKVNRSQDTIDTTTKDSGLDKEFEPSFREWSIDADGLLVKDDEGYKLLEDTYYQSKKVQVRMKTAGGNAYKGMAIITDFPIDAPYNDTVKYSLKLQGTGKLEKETIVE